MHSLEESKTVGLGEGRQTLGVLGSSRVAARVDLGEYDGGVFRAGVVPGAAVRHLENS